MPIILYFMNGCGYCVKAKDMFKEELKSGFMIMKHSSEAPSNIKGFPTFEYKGKTVSGLPSSKKELYEKLGVDDIKENYTKYKNPLENFIGVY